MGASGHSWQSLGELVVITKKYTWVTRRVNEVIRDQ